MAEPDRPPGQRSLFDFGVRRVAEKRPPPEVDQAEVERDVEAKRQARKQREQDAPPLLPAPAGRDIAPCPSSPRRRLLDGGREGLRARDAADLRRQPCGMARLVDNRYRNMMRWDDGWDAEPRRASKPFG
jgi:hypothetical protein